MKQCPKCNAVFPDGDRFCEIDGTPLLPARNKNNKTLTVVAVVGVSLGVLGVLAYLAFMGETAEPEPVSSSTVARQPFAPVERSTPRPPTVEPSPSPSTEPSPSPSVAPSPSPQPSASIVQFSSNPIATSAGAPAVKGQMIISLTNGGKIEAEEVWQTGEGIWYRKGSVMSMLDPKNVKSIEKLNSPAPTTTATKAP